MELLAVMSAAGLGLHEDLMSLLVITAIAAATPLIVGLLRLPVAEVVLLLALGVAFGPSGLGWITLGEPIAMFAEIGLAFLFFAAGIELEQHAIRGRSGKLAGAGWIASAVLAVAAAGILLWTGIIKDFLGVAICLTSTALGTLLPILRDKGLLATPFGNYFMGAGALGEFGPILAIALLLSTKSIGMAVLSIVIFAGFALLFAGVPSWVRSNRLTTVVNRGHETSSQTAVRLMALLLVGLLAAAQGLGLDAVLGAFVAGIIARKLSSVEEGGVLQEKFEGIAFGIFIPIFFVVSGARLDIESIVANPGLLLIFFVLLLLVRGVPQFFIYRRAIPQAKERAGFSLYVATGLPIIVAVTAVELDAGVMRPEVAAALVGAGALSVLVYPFIAQLLLPKPQAAPGRDRQAAHL